MAFHMIYYPVSHVGEHHFTVWPSSPSDHRVPALNTVTSLSMWPREAKITNCGQQEDAVHIMWREAFLKSHIFNLACCIKYIRNSDFSLYFLRWMENQGKRLLHREGTCRGSLKGRTSGRQLFTAARNLRCQRARAQSEQFINCLHSLQLQHQWRHHSLGPSLIKGQQLRTEMYI